jgi:hypothetical protein
MGYVLVAQFLAVSSASHAVGGKQPPRVCAPFPPPACLVAPPPSPLLRPASAKTSASSCAAASEGAPTARAVGGSSHPLPGRSVFFRPIWKDRPQKRRRDREDLPPLQLFSARVFSFSFFLPRFILSSFYFICLNKILALLNLLYL